ncbi:aldolase [Atractiella rhizophila]|nr:aldolase [Atractiella rhizophila]
MLPPSLRATPAIVRRALHTDGRRKIKIVEVGPRDGLQNEKKPIGVDVKAELVGRLADVGFRCVEAGSFVSPKWVPQMGGSAEVLQSPRVRNLFQERQTSLPVLVPNSKGLENLMKLNESHKYTDEIAVFTAATESFCKANTNCTIEESLKRLQEVAKEARDNGLKVRGYVSCVVGCPYEGKVDYQRVEQVSKALVDMGCYEVSLGDTVGVGTPNACKEMLETVMRSVPVSKLAAHCHNTFGSSIANVLAMVELGVNTVDSAIAGLGGCPYSPGATGNVASEDVIYALESEGYDTAKMEEIAAVGAWISSQLGRENASGVGKAILAKKVLRELQSEAKL